MSLHLPARSVYLKNRPVDPAHVLREVRWDEHEVGEEGDEHWTFKGRKAAFLASVPRLA
jgi:hypothetical protein